MRTLVLALALVALLNACTDNSSPASDDQTQPSATPSRQKATQEKLTAVVRDCFEVSIRPKKMVFACADFGFRARSITWSEWNRESARGHGVFVMNDCDPNCAEGHFHRRQGRIMLNEPGSCKGLDRLVFMSGRVVYESPFEGRSSERVYPNCPISS